MEMVKLRIVICIVSSIGLFGSMGLIFWSMAEDDGWTAALCTAFFMGFAYLFVKLIVT
jgi:hypothetical protein